MGREAVRRTEPAWSLSRVARPTSGDEWLEWLMTQMMARPCERCGWGLDVFSLACGNCGALAYRAELERLSAEAARLEPVDPAGAAARWRRCLDLLPRDSAQYAEVYRRFHALAAAGGPRAHPSRFGGGGSAGGAYPAAGAAPAHGYAVGDGPYAGAADELRELPPAEDGPLVAVLKTAGSMALSILVYALFVPGDLAGRLLFATGFVVLILVHELGHVAAMRYYGLSASPPIFIPFLGALIRLRQAPRDAKVEAVVGIGGPLLGTAGALACYGVYLAMPADAPAKAIVYLLAYLGFVLNLFNLLPVPPLDGGRITAAVSPRIWLLGIAGLLAMIAQEFAAGRGLPVVVLVLVLMFALPRVRATLARRAAGAADPYYAISRTARRSIGALYLALGVLLLVFRFLTRDAMDQF